MAPQGQGGTDVYQRSRSQNPEASGRRPALLRRRARRHFTRDELDALSVHDDIVLKLTDDLAADIPEDDRGPQSALPHWAGRGAGDEGAAIAVWQMFAPPPGVEAKLPGWLPQAGDRLLQRLDQGPPFPSARTS